MTRAEAIEILKAYPFVIKDQKAIQEAIEMAIASLETDEAYQLEYERTTKNDLGVDCISRKAVLDAIDTKAWEFCDYLISKGRNDEQKPVSHFADNLRECVREELPSVTPQEPIWIPVSERLPDTTDDEVLCWYEYYHWSQEKVLPEYGIGRYTSAWFGEVANGKDVRVIAWMPLPKPYEPQESENT